MIQNKEPEKIVTYDSAEAASIQTVTGWVSRSGRFWGNDEHMARYDGLPPFSNDFNRSHPEKRQHREQAEHGNTGGNGNPGQCAVHYSPIGCAHLAERRLPRMTHMSHLRWSKYAGIII